MTDTPQKPTPEQKKPAKPTRKSGRRKAGWLWLIMMVLIIAGAGYYYYHYHHKTISQSVVVDQGLAGKIEQNQQQIAQLQSEQQQLVDAQNQFLQQYAQHGLSDDKLTANNVVYLLQQASYKLSLEQDKQTTLALLQAAQQRIKHIKDPRFNKVAQVIEADITVLEKHDSLDYDKLSEQFNQLNKQIDQLQILAPGSALVQADTATPAKGWKERFQQTLGALKKVVMVEHTDKQYRPLLNQQQISSFKLYLSSLYAQALWAALNQHNSLYQHALDQAKQAVDQYLLNSNRDKSSLIAQTVALEKVEVSKQEYQPLNALAAAKNLQKELQQRQATKEKEPA